MNIRLAQSSDLEEIYSLFLKVNSDLIGKGYTFWNNGYPTKEDIFEGYNDGPMYVITENEKIVASVGIAFSVTEYYCAHTLDEKKAKGMIQRVGIKDEKTIILERLMVDPAYQGKGLGKILFNHLRTLYPDASFPIAVFKQNKPGIGFYKKLGFKDYGTQEEFEWPLPKACTLMVFIPPR